MGPLSLVRKREHVWIKANNSRKDVLPAKLITRSGKIRSKSLGPKEPRFIAKIEHFEIGILEKFACVSCLNRSGSQHLADP